MKAQLFYAHDRAQCSDLFKEKEEVQDEGKPRLRRCRKQRADEIQAAHGDEAVNLMEDACQRSV